MNWRQLIYPDYTIIYSGAFCFLVYMTSKHLT